MRGDAMTSWSRVCAALQAIQQCPQYSDHRWLGSTSVCIHEYIIAHCAIQLVYEYTQLSCIEIAYILTPQYARLGKKITEPNLNYNKTPFGIAELW